VVRHAGEVRGGGLSGEDREAGVNLKGVGPDDFGPEAFGQFKGQRGLADAGGAGEREGGRDAVFDVAMLRGFAGREKKKDPPGGGSFP
jgi:hypothetical protein